MPLLLTLAALQAAAAPMPPVDLICRGRGETIRMVPLSESEKKQYPGQNFRREVNPVRGVVQFRLRPEGSEAQLPPAMMATFGGSGWAKLIKLKVSDDRIEGKVELNFLYAPVFTLNRVTGEVSIDGSQSNFRGSCEPYDPATERRF